MKENKTERVKFKVLTWSCSFTFWEEFVFMFFLLKDSDLLNVERELDDVEAAPFFGDSPWPLHLHFEGDTVPGSGPSPNT